VTTVKRQTKWLLQLNWKLGSDLDSRLSSWG
jgi:hypothetical protein